MAPIQIQDPETLADLVGIPTYMLSRYAHNRDKYYKVFRLPKGDGRGVRTISAPSRELKGIQRWIAFHILEEVSLHPDATGYRKGQSIVSNASRHVGQDFVLNLDVKDFFPSITTPRVYGIFAQMKYSPQVSWILSRLLTYKNKLPQGAPSSPVVTNIICRKLDLRISSYCAKYDWSYSRYSDDITVSGFGSLGHAMQIISRMISEEGFAVNRRKVRVSRRGDSQQVTGLVVNQMINLPRVKRKLIRAMFHNAQRYPDQYRERRHELVGYVSLLMMINPDDSSLPVYREIVNAL